MKKLNIIFERVKRMTLLKLKSVVVLMTLIVATGCAKSSLQVEQDIGQSDVATLKSKSSQGYELIKKIHADMNSDGLDDSLMCCFSLKTDPFRG